MVHQEIEVPMADGIADAVIYRPEREGNWPGVLHLTDIYGIRPAYRDKAQQLASSGYVVLMPNVFYRTARPPVFERKPGATEAEFRKRFNELTSPLTPDAIAADAAAFVDVLARDASVTSATRLGVVGFCYTGAYAMRVAARCPDRIAAAASFHGGSLATDDPTSPHLLLPQIRAQLYFGHAVEDRSMPEEAIRKLEAALAAWGGKYQSEVYAGAHHGWTSSDNPAFNAPQSARAFSKLLEFFAAALS